MGSGPHRVTLELCDPAHIVREFQPVILRDRLLETRKVGNTLAAIDTQPEVISLYTVLRRQGWFAQ